MHTKVPQKELKMILQDLVISPRLSCNAKGSHVGSFPQERDRVSSV